MKRIVPLSCIMWSINLFSQSVYKSIEIPPDSLIKKHHVKTITSFFSDDTEKNTLDMVWKFDKAGNLISKELFDIDDPSIDKTLYFYNGNIKEEEWQIGTWLAYDTLKTKFYYDAKGRLQKTVTIGKYGHFDATSQGLEKTTTYQYINDTTVIVTYEGNNRSAMQSGSDSLVYNKQNLLLFKYSKSNDLKTSYHYNTKNQIIAISLRSISDPESLNVEDKFTYENGQVIRQEHTYIGSFGNHNKAVFTTLYKNNTKGLLETVERPLNFDTYMYEFY